MCVKISGPLLTEVEFEPDGIVFNKPVLLELSYKGADLSGVDEDKLAIFSYDTETGRWVRLRCEVDTRAKIIRCYLDHFSRYAVGSVN